jgi:hypothetical protein
MRHPKAHRPTAWHALTFEQKQERLAELRRRQQAQIELEARRLQHHR